MSDKYKLTYHADKILRYAQNDNLYKSEIEHPKLTSLFHLIVKTTKRVLLYTFLQEKFTRETQIYF
jgi:hypothetical protein